MTESRRDFVCRAATALGALSLTQLTAACGGMTMYRVIPVSGELRLDLNSLNELSVQAGTAILSVEGSDAPLFIVRYNPTLYYALSSTCTHRGCTVEEKGSRFVCPCHGSTYDRSGGVLKGPAEQPLRRYPTRLENNGRTLVIQYTA
jgi:cytochrome b6-f complex iron-sulfur subunit